MMNQEHVLNQIPDYVLGLLPRRERLWVEQHTAVCPQCRQLLHQEGELSQLVRTTLTASARPSTLRLRQIMPAPPRPRAIHWPGSRGMRQFALAVLLLVLLWGGLSLYQQQFSRQTTPDQLAVTATMTLEPTMTLASLEEEGEREDVATAVPALLKPFATPAPAPTPIAALPSLSLN